MAIRMPPSVSFRARSSKLSMSAGLSDGTQRLTLFSKRSSRVASSTKSSPSVLTAGSAAASSWSICLGAAERKTSQTAPSWIWVFSVPEESKLKVSVTSGATVL